MAKKTKGPKIMKAKLFFVMALALSFIMGNFSVHASSASKARVKIGKTTRYAKFELSNPRRLVLDVMGAVPNSHLKGTKPSAVEKYQDPVMTRFIYSLNGQQDYQINKRGDYLNLSFSKGSEGSDANPIYLVPKQGKVEKQIDTFELSRNSGKVFLTIGPLKKKPRALQKIRTKNMSIFQLSSNIPETLKKKIASSHLDSNLVFAQLYKKDKELLAIKTMNNQNLKFKKLSGGYWKVGFINAGTQGLSQVNVPAKVLFLSGRNLPQNNRFKGRRITLEFKEIDIHDLLRIISDVSRMNIIASDNVAGRVTIRLENVPWDQALEIILKSRGLGQQRFGNIIRVAPISVLQKERIALIKKQEAERKLAQLVVRLIPVNYSEVATLIPQVTGLLTKRGKVSHDERTNTLIVEDVQTAVDKIIELVQILDAPTPQVLIKARVVEINTSRRNEIGVSWGQNLALDQAHGTSTGLMFPNEINVKSGVNFPGSLPGPSKFGVNLPGSKNDIGGGVGVSFGSIAKGLNLSLFLSALEEEGVGDVISSPKILVLDNKEALIRQGLSIPTKTISAEGTQVKYVDALLELKVKPHIVSDGSVFLQIDITKDEPSESGAVDGQPAIFKKQASTELLVPDGDTKVIGGIFLRKKDKSFKKVPLFGDIPLLGWFFKSRTATDAKSELIIFITPEVVKPDRDGELSHLK